MKVLLAGTVFMMLGAITVRSAQAGSCGSGGSGRGGGGRGGGGSSATSSAATGPVCSEVSDVVGHQRCGRFGASWARRAGLPALRTELGFFTRQLLSGAGASGVLEHDTGKVAYAVAPERDHSVAAGASLRLAMALPAHLYVGADLELGGLVSSAAADVALTGFDAKALPSPTLTARRSLLVGAGGVVGVRGQLGRAALSAELVAGARDLAMSVESRHAACIMSETRHHTTTFVEPRLRLDFWLTPWITIAGFAGSEPFGNSRMVGASLAFHVRAFDRGL